MKDVSRNSPCPCGSGKKYKRCCLGKIIEFPKKDNFKGGELKTASEMAEMAMKSFSDKEFHSIEDLNEELGLFYKNQNKMPKAPFLGLSPAHMHSILYTPFNVNNEIFGFECSDQEVLKRLPLIEQSQFFLIKLKDVGQLKATQRGNLPKAFVVELFHQFFSEERYARLPNREDDLFQATRLKHLLELSGLIKKRNNKFSLTKNGEKIIDSENIGKLFDKLFLTFFNKWNWGFSDGYPELSLIQSSAAFNIYMLHVMAQDWILDDELGAAYLEAFPALVNEAGGYFGPEKEIVSCFSLRFLERVCLPFGLLESRDEGKFAERKTFYRVTPFFKNYFNFSTPIS